MISARYKRRAARSVVFFNFIYVNAGGARSTSQLIGEIKGQYDADIRVIDAYGLCSDYLNDLRRHGIEPIVLLPNWQGRTAIGGGSYVQRLVNMLLSIHGLIILVLRLRMVLREIGPGAMWVDTEKALFAAWLALPRGIPLVYLLRVRTPRIKPYCILAWKRVTMILSVAESIIAPFRSAGYGQRRLCTIHDGIDLNVVEQKAQREVTNLPLRRFDTLRIVFPAVIGDAHKGHEVGIRAIARFIQEGGKAELLLCGDVPAGGSPDFLQRMRLLVRELGIESHVHFLGWRNDVIAIMSRSDIVLLPSFAEGLPCSLIEAMAVAKPVIATRVDGIPELVRDGIDGILIDAGDVEALVRALHALSDPDLRRAMGLAGQERIQNDFTLRKHAQRFWNAIELSIRESPQSRDIEK